VVKLDIATKTIPTDSGPLEVRTQENPFMKDKKKCLPCLATMAAYPAMMLLVSPIGAALGAYNTHKEVKENGGLKECLYQHCYENCFQNQPSHYQH